MRFIIIALTALALTAGLSACGKKSAPVGRNADGTIYSQPSYPPAYQ